jgi:hypothetical protein
MRLWKQDKGHGAEVEAFIEVIKNGGAPPISFEEIVGVMKVAIDIANRDE